MLISGPLYLHQMKYGSIDDIVTLFKSIDHFELIKKEKPFDQIHKAIDQNQTEVAIEHLGSLEKKMRSVALSLRSESHNVVLSELQKSRNGLDQVLSFGKISKIIVVLTSKMEAFHQYVLENNWKTLIRVSSRSQTILENLSKNLNGPLLNKNLENAQEALMKNLDWMEEITQKSLLSEEIKGQITGRLNGMKTEHSMLKEYKSVIADQEILLKSSKKMFEAWLSGVSPQLSLRQLEIENLQKKVVYYISSLVGMVIVFIFINILLYRSFVRKRDETIKELVLSFIKDGLLPANAKLPIDFGHAFECDFVKLRDYLHKRMSFGKLFQEAVPFSCILLDSNLNVVWGNDLFYESWGLDEYKDRQDGVSWDFLSQYTNLGEQDPVMDALTGNIAGIYQLQIKYKTDDSRPFEMYVTPVEYLGEKRVMLFLYPLQSFNETMASQTKAIIGPVGRSLDKLMDGQFDDEFSSLVRKDFRVAGIDPLFGKFADLKAVIDRIQAEYEEKISFQENEIKTKNRVLEDVGQIAKRKDVIIKNMMSEFKNLKQQFVHHSEGSMIWEDIQSNLFHLSEKLVKNTEGLLMQTIELNSLLFDNSNAFNSVANIKADLKNRLKDLENYRTSLLQSIDQILLKQKNHEIDPVDRHQMLINLKVEIKSLDSYIQNLHSISTKLDVSISRVEMILQGGHKVATGELEKELMILKKTLEGLKNDTVTFKTNSQNSEEEFVGQMKVLIDSFKQDVSEHRELVGVIASN